MKFKNIWPVASVVLLYTGLIFGGLAWMFNIQTEQINAKLEQKIGFINAKIDGKIGFINAKIESIQETLNNHITDTNKKIDRLSDRFDRLSVRFDKLYEILLKDKEK